MGELLLCTHPMAAMPYYIEMLSLHIYSLEELCYVIEHHHFLVDEGFFDKELLLWIERELEEEKLAEELRETLEKGVGIVRLAELVFRAAGYLDYETEGKVIAQIRQLQYKSVLERRKMRADRYAANERYVGALLEYRRILQMEEECKKNPVMCGNIWHNLGTVYARMFLFKEAKECFETAYKHHMNIQSIYAAMAACKYLDDEEEILSLSCKYGIDGQELDEIFAVWGLAFPDGMEPYEQNSEWKQQLTEWKMEYQKKNGLF